ncbi:MAG TPA: pentapeptide repeat-containing protein, partial [Pyrinomonadaceae bacterium]
QAAAAAPDTGRGFTRFVNHWQRSVAGVALIAFNVFLLLMIRDENKIRTGWFNVDLSNEALAEEKKYAGDWVDLHEMHLERANVSGAFLRRANLSGAHLQAANLQRADLANADVSDARLRGASLAEADLTEAILSGADLSGANLNCAVLHGADLREATLRGAYLIGADLTGLPQGVREGAVELFAGVKSLSRARFQDDEVEARLRESRPGLFAEIEPSGAVVNRLAPDPEGSVVIFANGTTQVELLGADASRFGRKKQSEVSTFRDQLKPSYKLLATPEQAEVIARNLPELRGPLSAADEKLRSLRVLSVSEVTPVLVRARHHTYYLEEVFLVVEDSLPPPAARPTLWVFARSREVPVPCIR